MPHFHSIMAAPMKKPHRLKSFIHKYLGAYYVSRKYFWFGKCKINTIFIYYSQFKDDIKDEVSIFQTTTLDLVQMVLKKHHLWKSINGPRKNVQLLNEIYEPFCQILTTSNLEKSKVSSTPANAVLVLLCHKSLTLIHAKKYKHQKIQKVFL